MREKNEEYLIREKPLNAILRFSIPMMIGNLFQQFYTMADSVIVGRFVGEEALAAVGSSYALTSVFIAIAVGGGSGASVITSRLFGEGKHESMKESISTNLISFLALSILLGIAGFIFSDNIMKALNTPENIMTDAVTYLRIYFLGLPFLFMYNILSSVFNSLGNSKTPLFLLIFSSVLNIVLDIIAVTSLSMGVAGAAWATLISQALSAVISFVILLRTLTSFKTAKHVLYSSRMLRETGRIALPSIIQQATINLGMMLVQSVVNGYGSGVLAGYSASIRIDTIATVPLSTIGNAMSPYTAQNIGARKRQRIRMGLKSAFLLIAIFSVNTCLILQLFNGKIMSLFLGEEGTEIAYETGRSYLSYLGWFYGILGFAMITGGVLKGMGKMTAFTVASIANLSFRLIGAITLSPVFGVSVIWHIVPIGWSIYFLICLLAYEREKKRLGL